MNTTMPTQAAAIDRERYRRAERWRRTHHVDSRAAPGRARSAVGAVLMAAGRRLADVPTTRTAVGGDSCG